MKHRIVILFVLAAFLLSACNTVRGSGNVVTETRSVSSFDRISLSGQGEVILTQGEDYSLEIEAEDNIIPILETEVGGGKLSLGTRDSVTLISPTEPIRYYITMPEINGLDVSGSGSITSERINTSNLVLDISGSGEISIATVSAATVRVDISGSGSVGLAGMVDSQTINVSGSGSYSAGDLESATANIEVSGSGSTTVWVNDTLDISVSGSGNVEYYGNPAVSQEVSGSGNLRSLDER